MCYELMDKSRKYSLKQVCKGRLILLVNVADKEVDSTQGLITLTATEVDVVKGLMESSQDGVDNVIQVKVPKACQCNKTINASGTGRYMIITERGLDGDNVLWLQPGDSLVSSKDQDLGRVVNRKLRRCNNQDTLYGGNS